MPVARGFGLNGKSYYTNITKPCEVLCNFIVDSANGNGLGIRSLKSNGYINNVFMHTSATPGKNNGMTNPNPAAGYALIQFKNNFNFYLGGFNGQVNVNTSTSTTSTTAGDIYTITSLGTTTLAQWLAAGLPAGFTPAVGASFVAIATGAIGGTGTVGLPGVPAIVEATVIGNANTTISNSNIAANGGAQLVVGLYAATSSSVTTLAATAPADNTAIAMSFMYDASSVTIDGL